MKFQVNVPKKEPVKVVVNKSNNRTEVYTLLRSKGFLSKEINDITIMKLADSDAFFLRLSNQSIKVLLWCLEENYVYRDIKYSDCDINDTMTLEQIVLYFLTNK